MTATDTEKTILIIDDDAKLRALLTEYLQGYGFAVECRSDGSDACQALEKTAPCAVILDVMMPGKDGMQVLGEIRTRFDTPVIMLTAKGEDMDRVVGLELGADDYVSKPFNPRELLARIRAVLRRTEGTAEKKAAVDTELTAGGITLDTVRRVMTIGDESAVLGPTESKLLAVFLRTPDVPLSRDELMDRVWGKSFAAYDRTIDVHISKLRAELKPFKSHRDRIHTVWGTGYMFRSQP